MKLLRKKIGEWKITCASWNSSAATSIPISSAFVNNLRHADALVVRSRGIFCVGTESNQTK